MTKKQREIVKAMGWQLYPCKIGPKSEKGWEIRKSSPAGEYFSFAVEDKDFDEKVREYAAEFDPDEHIEMWVNAKYNLNSSRAETIPSIRELVNDADAIDKMLQDLASALSGVMPGTANENEEATPVSVRVFIWNGFTEGVIVTKGQKEVVSVNVYNGDDHMNSNRKEYENLLNDSSFEIADWTEDALSNEDEDADGD